MKLYSGACIFTGDLKSDLMAEHVSFGELWEPVDSRLGSSGILEFSKYLLSWKVKHQKTPNVSSMINKSVMNISF